MRERGKEWEEGIIVPIKKRGERKKVEEFRGITIMPSLYKIYTIVLASKLEQDIEEKGILERGQAGFRKGMGTLDNIFVINYLVNRQLSKKRGKLMAFFVDLKATFDTVNREILTRIMHGRGVRKRLVERCKEVLRETRNKIRVGGGGDK